MRRKHRYDEFIVNYLRMLAENGKLTKLIQTQIDAIKKRKKTNHLRIRKNKLKKK